MDALTVQDVLEFDSIRRSQPEPVSGFAALDAKIRWAHVVELADLAPLLTGGELILTNGRALTTDRAQIDYVQNMHSAGVAAVILALNHASPTAPEAMLAAARSVDLPLIVLHEPARFLQIAEEIQTRLIEHRVADFEALAGLATRLVPLLDERPPLQDMVDTIASVTGAAAVVETLGHQVLASSGLDVIDVLRDWPRISRRPSLAPTGKVRFIEDGTVAADLTPAGHRAGRLLLFPRYRRPAVARETAAMCAQILNAHWLITRSARKWERESPDRLLADLVAATGPSDQLHARATAFGVDLRRRSLVPVVFDVPNRQATDWPQSARMFQTLAAADGVSALVGEINDGEVLALIGVPSTADPVTALDEIAAAFLRELATRRLAVGIAAGSATVNLGDLGLSVAEARQASRATLTLKTNRPVARICNVRLQGIVRLLQHEPELQGFIQREIGPIMGRPDLLHVLRAYLRSGMNKVKTAQLCHLSRPAVYRRLDEAATLLDADLTDLERLAALQLAILAFDG